MVLLTLFYRCDFISVNKQYLHVLESVMGHLLLIFISTAACKFCISGNIAAGYLISTNVYVELTFQSNWSALHLKKLRQCFLLRA